MSDDSNTHRASAGVCPAPPTSCPPKQEMRYSDYKKMSSQGPMQGYHEAGPDVASPPVSDPTKYGPQHLPQAPLPPERTSQRDDDFSTGCCCCL
ncbi:PREDICTED: uncharacterized protein LOC105108652 isoform X2 [Populus euphratica]|uniref:Uncharacterized protein LOC105108652 isoform X2 n=1 Tax=Populus euphratica TaxID=75702 RepID=A0AAJ6SZQ7_POPEU|nr:PREDICTED: uncharacterized protein LOC105108652 isoform X2 [Populus euphratica]